MRLRVALAVVSAAAGLLAVAVLVCWVATALERPALPSFGPLTALDGAWRVVVKNRWGDPTSAFPRAYRRQLPTAPGWWAATALVAMGIGAVCVALGGRLDVRRATPRLARRWFEVTGARPRAWARPRDLRALRTRRRTSDRLVIGTIGRLRRRVAVRPEFHLMVVAPTGQGKSSRFVIPWALQIDGCPLIVTSTKLDVVEHTVDRRARQGDVFVWDPFGPKSSGWSPLAGCETWEGALRRAKWMSSALGDNDHGAARFWNGEASKLLGPLLYAAATRPDGSMRDVLSWLDDPDSALSCCQMLDDAGNPFAREQLGAVLSLDDRNRGTTFMSAAHLVEAYRYPAVQRTDRREITPGRLLNGQANTLYIVASEDEQQILSSLVVAMVGEMLSYRQRAARIADGSAASTLWLLLDETANIAPIEQLPKYLSGVRGANVRIATVWQDHAQLAHRYREAEGTILSNSQIKLYLGPITDEATRRYLEGALGEERVQTRSRTAGRHGSTQRSDAWRPRVSAQAMQQLARGRALLIHSDLPAALIETKPWFADRRLRARAGAPGRSSFYLALSSFIRKFI